MWTTLKTLERTNRLIAPYARTIDYYTYIVLRLVAALSFLLTLFV
jgi:hypothetical protein